MLEIAAEVLLPLVYDWTSIPWYRESIFATEPPSVLSGRKERLVFAVCAIVPSAETALSVTAYGSIRGDKLLKLNDTWFEVVLIGILAPETSFWPVDVTVISIDRHLDFRLLIF